MAHQAHASHSVWKCVHVYKSQRPPRLLYLHDLSRKPSAVWHLFFFHLFLFAIGCLPL